MKTVRALGRAASIALMATVGCLSADVATGDAPATPPRERLERPAAKRPGVAVAFPVRAARAVDGTLYVSDAQARAVFGFRGERRVFELLEVDRPLGVAVHGERLYVGDAGRRRVRVFSTVDGAQLPALGTGDGEVEMPNAVAVTPDGARIYVVDSRLGRVIVYGADGAALGRFGADGPDPMRFPVAVAVDDARVAVADQANHRVLIYDHDGNRQRVLGALPDDASRSLDDYRGRLVRPQGLTFVGDELAVLDAYLGSVQLFGADGTPRGFVGGRGACETCVDLPLDVVWDPAGRALVVLDPNRRRWVRVPFQPRRRP